MAQLQAPYASPAAGVATVAVGGTTVTVTGVLDDTNCIEGDHFRDPATGYESRILARVDATHFTIPPWRSTAMTAANYEIYPDASLRVSSGRNTATVNQLINRLKTKGIVWYLPDTFADPAAAGWGADDDQYVYQFITQKWWRMDGGAWVVSGPPTGVPMLLGNNTFAGTQAFSNATDATSATAGGAVTVAGGLAVAKKLFVGGTASIAGVLSVSNTTDSNRNGGGAINTVGGIFASKRISSSSGFTVGVIESQWNSLFSARNGGQCIEWGHANVGGYGNSLGCHAGTGQGWIALSGSAGTTNNTYRSNGYKPSIIQSDLGGGFFFGTVANANADNQALVQTGGLTASGALSVASIGGTGSTLTVAGTLTAASKGHLFGAASGSLYDQTKVQSDANILLYARATNDWAGIGTDNSGHFWIRSGTSGLVKPSFVVTTGNTVVMPFYGAGTLSTTSNGTITSSSDERLKKITGDFERGLAEIQQLRPILYQWNDDSGLADGVSYAGFGAGAVRKVIPEAVGRDGRGYLTLNDRPIIAALINAVIELDDKITRLAA